MQWFISSGTTDVAPVRNLMKYYKSQLTISNSWHAELNSWREMWIMRNSWLVFQSSTGAQVNCHALCMVQIRILCFKYQLSVPPRLFFWPKFNLVARESLETSHIGIAWMGQVHFILFIRIFFWFHTLSTV